MVIYPNVSALMAIYHKDSPDYLRTALESLENQTWQIQEYILVIDGLINSSLDDVIQDFQRTNNVVIVRQEKNVGLAKALQNGLKHASNELILRADADDISVSNRLEAEFSFIINHTNIGAVGSYVAEFDSDPQFVNSVRTVPVESEDIKKFAQLRSPMNHPSVLLRKSAVERAGGYIDFEKLEDYHLWVRMILNDIVLANIPEPLVLMRAGDGMYKRRGGFKYLKGYFNLRKNFVDWGFTTKRTEFIADVGMLINVLIPNRIRSTFYRIFLRN